MDRNFQIRDHDPADIYNRQVAPSSRKRSGTRVSNSLVALGSAAVLAVYTAGYTRTRAAADRLDAAERHRPVLPATPAASLAPVARLDAAPAPVVTPAPAQISAPPPAADAHRALDRPRAVSKPARETAVSAAPLVTPSPQVVPAQDASEPAPTPTPVASPTAAVTPTPTPTPALPKWNDGSFSGWGRSRHGDIQATIAIEDGKIVYAAITVCATRYPCDVIAKLPGQVLARQSPEVDFVAGATESTNAFYYAVVEALNKAK